uniref:Uncharacterized protein n=1 Tax=Rhizophora mucronata TaxID=61149 RepID=A0A2P2QKH1_RHIMU
MVVTLQSKQKIVKHQHGNYQFSHINRLNYSQFKVNSNTVKNN